VTKKYMAKHGKEEPETSAEQRPADAQKEDLNESTEELLTEIDRALDMVATKEETAVFIDQFVQKGGQ